jgi:hypothetical protein
MEWEWDLQYRFFLLWRSFLGGATFCAFFPAFGDAFRCLAGPERLACPVEVVEAGAAMEESREVTDSVEKSTPQAEENAATSA